MKIWKIIAKKRPFPNLNLINACDMQCMYDVIQDSTEKADERKT